MQRVQLKVVAVIAVVLIGMMHIAEAQLVRGFISGTVTDETNAVIPGVEVRITSKATNISREGLTNETGFYRFAAVEPGDYSVEFHLPGFKTQKIDNITVSTAQEVVINQKMVVGPVSAEVSVADTPGVTLSMAAVIPEAVQEVQVQTSAYSAEFGRTSGAQVSAITRSGSNKFHGDIWDYYRGSWMEPLSLTNKRAGLTETPRFVHNQFGGSVGGALVKDRTFFFALLEANRRREADNTNNSTAVTIPTPAGYAALSSVPLGTDQTLESRQAALSALSFLPGIQSRVKNYDNLQNLNIVTTYADGSRITVPVQIGTVLTPVASPSNFWYNA